MFPGGFNVQQSHEYDQFGDPPSGISMSSTSSTDLTGCPIQLVLAQSKSKPSKAVLQKRIILIFSSMP
uniref:Uncharacterized protein n=1 Tax=Panagrellus redivivus TaxID=6233 RepID=A0A7E4V518_PANRE